MKNLLILLIPPIFIRLKNYFRNRYFGYLFWGKYSNLDEFKNFIKEDTYLLKEQHQQSVKNYLKNKEIYNFDLRNSFLPIFVSGLSDINLKILDIGGGFNSCFKYINKSQKKNIDVTVLERDEIVTSIKELGEINKNVQYTNEIISNDYEIIFFGSSIQYFLEFKKIKEIVTKCSAQYIIIVDTAFTQVDEDIFSLQVNMFPSLIPYKINSISKIENKFNKLNYNLIYKSKRSCGKHKHLNKNQLFSRDLIFKRS